MSAASRDERLRFALDDVRARCDVAIRREADPVGFVHRFREPLDQELIALLAASMAFGNVTTIRQKLTDLLRRLGPRPRDGLSSLAEAKRRLDGFRHRLFLGEDVARLLYGARRVQDAEGSLGASFAGSLEATGNLRDALSVWCARIRDEGGLHPHPVRRGPAHLLPDPARGSGAKRLLLFLRWMIRGPDGIDLGLWEIEPRWLLCPVDTHIHKLARNLGFTQRTNVSWRTAEEITQALARFDAQDPVKYDFSLCHLGMLQRCPSRRDAKRCAGCPVMPVCRHWQVREGKSLRSRPR